MEGMQRVMAIDPNSLNPKGIKRQTFHGLDFRSDGGLSIQKVETEPDGFRFMFSLVTL